MLFTRAARRGEREDAFLAVIRRPAAPRTSGNENPRQCRPVWLWRRSAAILREAGPRALLWSGLGVLGVRRVIVYRVKTAEALARGEPVPGVTVDLLSDHQIPAYRALRPDTPEPRIRRRLQAGAACFAAWRDGRLVAVRWLTTDRAEIGYLGAAVGLCPGVWYAFDAYTLPAERRHGISGMVTAALVRHAESLGATSVINTVVPENRYGRGLARRRSQPLGVLGGLRLGRWSVVAARLPPGYLAAPAPLRSATPPDRVEGRG